MNGALEGIRTYREPENAQLGRWVRGLDAAGWATITTAEGWTVAHQIAYWRTTMQAFAGLPGTNPQRKAA